MPYESPTRKTRKLKPPPDFGSRKGQAKLFVLVVAAMAVLYLVTEAAKPETWAVLFGEPVAEQPKEVPEEIDTRLVSTGADAVDVVRIIDPFRGSLDDAETLDARDPATLAVADGWAAFYEQSSRDDHDMIAKGLLLAREPRVFDEKDSESWSDLLARIDRFWMGYRENAMRSLEPRPGDPDAKPLDEAEKQHWVDVLDQVGAAWDRDRGVLAKLAQRGDLEFSDDDEEHLRVWQLRWERMGLAAIEDDTVHRPAETDAWFRLLDVLNSTSAKQLESQPATPVGFVQLFKQTDEYRGKLVRVKGRIMQAKRSRTTRNVYGIEYQYILWIRPDGGPDSPFVVYALELPPGFPSLDEPNLPGDYTKLREDVVVTGYFFKRWAYASKQGTLTSPLILAKTPKWIPGPDLSARVHTLPSRWVFLTWVAGCAAFAVLITALAYQLTRFRSPAVESFTNSAQAQRERDESLSNANAGPGPLESLRILEQRDRSGGGSSQ